MEEATKAEISRLVNQMAARTDEHGRATGRSQATVAAKCEVSTAMISNIASGKRWETINDKTWNKVAAAIGYHTLEWKVVDTENMVAVRKLCQLAQHRSTSLGIAHDAGQGKSAALKRYANEELNVYLVECDQHWTQKEFMAQLYRAMGKDPRELSTSFLAEAVITELRRKLRPLVIIDEADKLRDASAMFFISLYNKLDGICGFVVSGAPFLRTSWEKKAMRNKRGFREIYSRLGRRFVELYDIKEKDVRLICEANGITDTDLQAQVWNGCKTDQGGRDLRRVKREVERLRETSKAA